MAGIDRLSHEELDGEMVRASGLVPRQQPVPLAVSAEGGRLHMNALLVIRSLSTMTFSV